MRRFSPLAAACGLIAVGWATWSAPVSAGTLQVNPVLLEIDADRRTATVTVRNQEREPIAIRAYPLGWRQDGGEDAYAETSAVIVSPPIFTIAPGGTQLVRVGLRTPSAAPQAFRLIIEEVPAATPGEGIRVALRLNLPLHAMMARGEPAALRWSARRQADGSWTLEAANAGSAYVRLDPDAARAATGIRFEDTVHLGTVLPGATRRWRLGAQLRIEDDGRFRAIQRTATDVAAQGSD